jgi:hypothetical protein
MKSPAYYQDRAEQCARRADEESDPRKKVIWKKLARSYRQMEARAKLNADTAWSKKHFKS